MVHGRSKDVAAVVPFQEKHHFSMWPMKPSFHVGNRVAVFSGGGEGQPLFYLTVVNSLLYTH